MLFKLKIFLVFFYIFFSPYLVWSQSNFATQVIDFEQGNGSGIFNPQNALGPPVGGGLINGSLDVHSLGIGGSLTLGFDVIITNGPGADFIVSENPFFLNGTNLVFSEAVFVEVSSDGENFARFPNRYLGPNEDPGPFTAAIVGTYSAMAGEIPVLFGNPNYPTADAQDLVEAGGDAFDLQDLSQDPLVLNGLVDLNNIHFVRLIDVISGTDTDTFGHVIWDSGVSADIDAVTVIHHTQNQSPNAPNLILILPPYGSVRILLTDPDGMANIDWDSLHVAIYGLPMNNPLENVLVDQIMDKNLFSAKINGSLIPPNDIFQLTVSLKDQEGHRVGVQRSIKRNPNPCLSQFPSGNSQNEIYPSFISINPCSTGLGGIKWDS